MDCGQVSQPYFSYNIIYIITNIRQFTVLYPALLLSMWASYSPCPRKPRHPSTVAAHIQPLPESSGIYILKTCPQNSSSLWYLQLNNSKLNGSASSNLYTCCNLYNRSQCRVVGEDNFSHTQWLREKKYTLHLQHYKFKYPQKLCITALQD